MNLKRVSLLSSVWVGLSFAMVPLSAQEPFSAEGIPPESEYVYSKHYEQVQEIMKTPDLAAREQKLTAFMNKLHPQAKIRQYMEAFFGQIVQDYEKAGQKDKAAALSQKMLQMFPKSDAAAAQQLKAAYDGKNWAKVIELGEPMRAKSPSDGAVLAMLAEAYRATNNNAKVMEIGTKLIQVLGPEKAIYYVVFLADQYRTKNDLANAAKYYDMALQAYPSRVPEGWQPAQWNQVKATAYQVEATQAWGAQDFQGVIAAYNNLLKTDPHNDAAYMFMGLSYWRLQQLDQAQDALAKAVVLNKSNSAKARQYLEQLYKPRNNNTLDGLDQVLAKAKADLRL